MLRGGQIEGDTWRATFSIAHNSRSLVIRKNPVVQALLDKITKPLLQTPFQQELERTGTKILFSKYPDDTFRLYKPDSIIGDTPAGYSEERVSVKVIVKTRTEEFMVSIRTTRTELDRPDTEEYLAQAAYRWARLR